MTVGREATGDRTSRDSVASVGRKVVLGRIVGAFGIGGWLKIESYTDPPGNILNYSMWQVGQQDAWRTVKQIGGRVTAKGVQAALENISDRTAAERLRGELIAVDRDELPAPKAGEYYWDDLLGLDAYSPSGERLGRIDAIRAMPAHPLLAIVGQRDGKRVEHLVPLVKQRLLTVDLDARRATVDWESDWL